MNNNSPFWWGVNDTWLMMKRSILHIIRSLDQVMSLVMFPIMFMLLNVYVLGGSINTGIDYVDYLFAGILVQTLAFGANYTTIGSERKRSTMPSFISTAKLMVV